MRRSSAGPPEGIADLGTDTSGFIITDVVGVTEADQLSADREKDALNAERDRSRPRAQQGKIMMKHTHVHIHGAADGWEESKHPRDGGKFSVHQHSMVSHEHSMRAKGHEVAAKTFPMHAPAHVLAAARHREAAISHNNAAAHLTSNSSSSGHHAAEAHKVSAIANAASAKLSAQIQGKPPTQDMRNRDTLDAFEESKHPRGAGGKFGHEEHFRAALEHQRQLFAKGAQHPDFPHHKAALYQHRQASNNLETAEYRKRRGLPDDGNDYQGRGEKAASLAAGHESKIGGGITAHPAYRKDHHEWLKNRGVPESGMRAEFDKLAASEERHERRLAGVAARIDSVQAAHAKNTGIALNRQQAAQRAAAPGGSS